MKPGGLPILTRAIATMLASLILPAATRAADGTWTRLTGSFANGLWGNSSNWLNGQIADGVDAIADFSTLDIGSSSIIALESAGPVRTVGAVKFQDAGSPTSDWQLAGGPLRLDVSSGMGQILVLNRTLTIHSILQGDDGIEIGAGDGTGGRVVLTQTNTFTGGLKISGGIVELSGSGSVGGNAIVVSGSGVETRVVFNQRVFSPQSAVNHAIVIEAGVTPGAGHGVIESTAFSTNGVSGPITINGSTGNGGHFAGPVNGLQFGIGGAITSSVPVVQAGGRVGYYGGGDYSALHVTGTAETIGAGITTSGVQGVPSSAVVSLGADGAGDGLLNFNAGSLTLAGLDFGSAGSTDAGAVTGRAPLILTGDVASQGDASHSISLKAISLGDHRAIFAVADGAKATDLSISAPITGSAGFEKTGAGTLLLTDSVAVGGVLSVDAGILAGNTTIAGTVAVAAGATLAPGTTDSAGSISAAAITFAPGATLNLNLGTGGDSLAVTGENGLRADGLTTLAISTFNGPLGVGIYNLVSYSGAIQGAGFSAFSLPSLPGRTTGALVDTGTAVALNVTSNNAVIWTGANGGAWDAGGTANWKLQSSGSPTGYLAGDDVIFDDSGTNRTITLDVPVSPSRVAFANSAAAPYSISGAGGIQGPAIVRKTGAGTVTLRTANSYAGSTTISGGTLEIDYDGGALTGTSGVAIEPGGTLKLKSSNADFSFDRPLSGAGTVVIDANAGGDPGPRTVEISGDNSNFTGVLRLAPTSGGGSFRTSYLRQGQIGAASVVVEPGAQLRPFTNDYANAIQLAGIGFLEAAGGTPHPGAGLGTEGGRGALVLDTATNLTGPIVLAGNAKVDINGSDNHGILSGDISSLHPGDQLVVGGGTAGSRLILTGTNSYGPTWINSGSGAAVTTNTLQIGNNGTTGTLGTGDVTLLGEMFSTAVLRFDRTDGYVLGSSIASLGNTAKTRVEGDVRGAGFSTNGQSIDLGPATTGGTFRVGETRADARAIVTGSLSAGTIAVASGQTGAVLEVGAGGDVSVGALDVGAITGAAGTVIQTGGDVRIAGSLRIAAASANTSAYQLSGGTLTLTAPAGGTFPYGSSTTGETGGVYAGIDGTGNFTQTGGTLSTNWIVLDQAGETRVDSGMPGGVDAFTLNGGQLVLKTSFGLISRFDSTAFALNGGTIQAAPGISPNLDSATITVGGSVTLDANGPNTFSLYGPLGGSGTIVLSGGGSLRTRDGTGSGAGKIGGNMPGGSLRAVSVTLGAGMTLTADRSQTDVWTGALTGAGSLVKQNTGALYIAGNASGFTGSTTVTAGRLDLPAGAASPSIAVADGAALGGEPATANLKLGVTTGSTVFFDASTASALTAGSLEVDGVTALDFSVAPVGPGPFTVLNYGTRTGAGSFALAGSSNYRASNLTDTGSSILLEVTTKDLRWTGSVSGVWDLKNAANFTDGANAETFFSGDSVTFDDAGANPAVGLTGVLSPWRVVVAADVMNYSFSGSPITGPGAIVKSGLSTLTLSTQNSYSGPTIIQGGAVRFPMSSALGDGSATNTIAIDGGELHATSNLDLGAARSLSIGAAGAILAASPEMMLTVSGTVSGAGPLRIAGGTVVLKGDNSGFSGDVIVDSTGSNSEGTILRVGNSAGLTAGTVTIHPFTFSGRTAAIELDGVTIGPGVGLILKTSDATGQPFSSRLSTSAGANAWTGPISVSGSGAAEISASHTLTITGPVGGGAEGFSGVFVAGGERSSGNGFLNGTVTLPGALLRKDGPGTWTIASAGNAWGDTRITAGTLALGADNALPATTHLIGENVNFGTKLDLRGFSQTVAGLTLEENGSSTAFAVTNTAAQLSSLTVRTGDISTFGGSAVNFANLLTGNLRLIKDGPGTLVLGGRNTFTGGTFVNEGTLRINGTFDVVGASDAKLTIADGATVDLNGKAFNLIGEWIVSGSGVDGFGAIQNTGASLAGRYFWQLLTLAGDTTIGTDSRFDITTYRVNGGDFTLTKTGAGETWWSPFVGATMGDIVVEGGSFVVNGSSNLGSDAHRIIVKPGGTLSTSGGRTNAKPVTLSGGLLTALDGTGAWTGAITLDGAGTGNRIGAAAGARVNLSGTISGSGGFEKVDAGVVELRGMSGGWTGEIRVTAGALLVSGSISGSTVNVDAGTLGGSGGTLGTVNVLAGGTLAPGESIGTLNAGAVAFAAAATFNLEINSDALTTDLLASSSALDLALATLNAADLGGAALTSSERFTFITAGSVNGTFAGLPNGASLTVGASDFTIEYTPTSVALVAVPEPGSLASLLGSLGVLLGMGRLRRGEQAPALLFSRI